MGERPLDLSLVLHGSGSIPATLVPVPIATGQTSRNVPNSGNNEGSSSSANSSTHDSPCSPSPPSPGADFSNTLPKDGTCMYVPYSSFCLGYPKVTPVRARETVSPRGKFPLPLLFPFQPTGVTAPRRRYRSKKAMREASRPSLPPPSMLSSDTSSVVTDTVYSTDNSPQEASPVPTPLQDGTGDENTGNKTEGGSSGATEAGTGTGARTGGGERTPIVIESYSRFIGREMFLGTSQEEQGGDMVGRGDRFTMIKPATVALEPDRDGTQRKHVALGLIVQKAVTNKVLLLDMVRRPDRPMWDVVPADPVGWVLPQRVGDLKWLSRDRLCVASGAKLVFLNEDTATPLTSKRPKPRDGTTVDNAIQLPSEQNIVRELEPTTDGTSVIVGDERGGFSIVQHYPSLSCQIYNFSSPVSSVRNMPATVSLSCVSCTLANGHICIFDRRMRWSPCLEVVVRGDDSAELYTHDWQNNTAVLGFSSGLYKTAMFGPSVTKPVLMAESNMNDVTACDVRAHPTRDEFAAFGLPNFCVGTASTSSVWFAPPIPPTSSQACVLGEYFDEDTILTVSDDGYLKLWSFI